MLFIVTSHPGNENAVSTVELALTNQVDGQIHAGLNEGIVSVEHHVGNIAQCQRVVAVKGNMSLPYGTLTDGVHVVSRHLLATHNNAVVFCRDR